MPENIKKVPGNGRRRLELHAVASKTYMWRKCKYLYNF